MTSPVDVSQENVECLLELSVRFGVGSLMDYCCDFLAGTVHVESACAILALADVGATTY